MSPGPVILRLAAVALVAGCGADTGAPGLGNQITIITSDFHFDAPDTVPAGLTRIRMVNQGPSYHHIQIVRLADSMPAARALRQLPAAEPLPGWMVPVGGVEGSDSLEQDVIVSLVFTPGEYLLLCRITAEDGTLHLNLGMAHPFVVVPDGGTADRELPEADAIVTLQDFSFEVSGPIRAGHRRIRVENRGPSEHHLAVARLDSGATLRDVLEEKPDTPWPALVVGGTAGQAPGVSNLLELDLETGEYALLCFVDDPVRGMMHSEMGMARQITIIPD